MNIKALDICYVEIVFIADKYGCFLSFATCTKVYSSGKRKLGLETISEKPKMSYLFQEGCCEQSVTIF
jgi:hypothetical protein